jgi:hypothetical protein
MRHYSFDASLIALPERVAQQISGIPRATVTRMVQGPAPTGDLAFQIR